MKAKSRSKETEKLLERQAEQIFEEIEDWLTDASCEHRNTNHPYYCPRCGPKFIGIKWKYCYLETPQAGPDWDKSVKLARLLKESSK